MSSRQGTPTWMILKFCWVLNGVVRSGISRYICAILHERYANIWGCKYDWLFESIPQKHCNDRIIVWSRGKGLGTHLPITCNQMRLTALSGGSSAMNFYFWTKPPAADVNTWEELGNPGWNWDAFQKYTLRAEQYVSDPPSNKNRV